MGQESYTEEVMRTVRSHVGRSRQGGRLVKEGRPLSEIQTPIEGPITKQLVERRKRYLDSLGGVCLLAN